MDKDSSFQQTCRSCQATMRISTKVIGKKISCPRCKTSFVAEQRLAGQEVPRHQSDQMKFSCSICGNLLSAPLRALGKKVQCPKCQARLMAPDSPSAPGSDLDKAALAQQSPEELAVSVLLAAGFHHQEVAEQERAILAVASIVEARSNDPFVRVKAVKVLGQAKIDLTSHRLDAVVNAIGDAGDKFMDLAVRSVCANSALALDPATLTVATESDRAAPQSAPG